MNRLLGTSVVGLGGVGVSGIRCRAFLYSPFAQMVKSAKVRSSDDDCKICRGSVDNTTKMDSEVDFSLIFSLEDKAQKDAGHPKELHYGSVFTGELQRRHLDYLTKLDWSAMRHHIADFPRGMSRSEDEMKIIFDKWVEAFSKVYYSDECRKEVFDEIKEKLAVIDDHNSTDDLCKLGLNERAA